MMQQDPTNLSLRKTTHTHIENTHDVYFTTP